MNKPGFSVIIPVYNGAAVIENAIRSCLQQTILPGEIIVIDDASTDDTSEIIGSVSSDLIQYHRNGKNSGPSFSRNRAMRLASYSWILFLDADDVFHPNKIEVIQYCIRLDETIRAIGHSFDIQGKNVFPLNSSRISSLPLIQKLTSRQVLVKNPVVTPALAVLTANDIFFKEEMSYAEDHDFILRTTEKFGLAYIDLTLCSLSRQPLTKGGLSSYKWKMRKGEMKMYIDYCKRNNRQLAIPFLLLFSLAKHVRMQLLSQGKNK